jgi:hypothetical protein
LAIRNDHTWFAASFDKRQQLARDTATGDRGVRDLCQAFARHVIEEIENAKAPAAGKLVMDEIQ